MLFKIITQKIAQSSRVLYRNPTSPCISLTPTVFNINGQRSFSSKPKAAEKKEEGKKPEVKKEKYVKPIPTPEQAKQTREWFQAAAERNVGALFHYIQYKGRSGNILSLKDLKSLAERCVVSEDIDALKRGVEYYQSKRVDFNEEIAALFINKCIELQRPCTAANVISVYKNRMGAWVTPEQMHRLFQALAWREDKEELKMMLDVTEIMHLKRVPLSVETLEIMLKMAIKYGKYEAYNRAVELLGLSLGTEKGALLAARFPKVENVEVDAGADDGK